MKLRSWTAVALLLLSACASKPAPVQTVPAAKPAKSVPAKQPPAVDGNRKLWHAVSFTGKVDWYNHASGRVLTVIRHWQRRKRDYYLVQGGDGAAGLLKLAGRVAVISGEARLLEQFGWGAGQYELRVQTARPATAEEQQAP